VRGTGGPIPPPSSPLSEMERTVVSIAIAMIWRVDAARYLSVTRRGRVHTAMFGEGNPPRYYLGISQ
jgi:hypothetical protein